MVRRPQEVSTDSDERLHDPVQRRESLELSGRRELPHLAPPRSCRVMRDLRASVRVLIGDVDHRRHHCAARGRVGAPLQPPRVDRTEPLVPRPNRLGGDRHASLREEIFGSAEAAAEPMGEPDRVADDVGRESIAVIAGRRASHRPILPLVAST